MMELLTKWTELLLAVLYVMFKLTSGYIEVSPNPALIYENAPPGTPVLTVTAKNDVTLEALDSVSITSLGDSAYFSLHKQLHLPAEWILRVKLPIDKQVGYLFEFTVYTLENTIAKSAQVKINVTEQNIFHPSFEKSTYSFVALRNGFDINLTHVGSVKATDGDKETYNSVFHYHILDPVASAFFYVDLETGDLELIDNIPYRYTNMTFNVTAIDGGSPQLLNSTTVTVTISDVPPPEIFCVAVEDSVARICWKDPTNGSYVMKYELLFQMDGQNATKIPVHVNGIKDETCSIVRGNQLGRNYTFTVRVLNGLEWSPDSLQRKVQIERKGLYGDCPLFSNCSVWEPCKSHGECLVNDDLSYTCNCSKGWGGENCTGRDRCAKSPCKTGTCNFTGDRKYTCDCPPTHYGNDCQFFNVCSSYPCQNNAECIAHDNETFTCICPDNFVGEMCELPDPCTPSQCVHGNCSAYNNNTGFTCACAHGYSGYLCHIGNPCILNDPCEYGQCIVDETSLSSGISQSVCNCSVGYRGYTCDILDICELSEYNGQTLCMNNSTCKYKVGSYDCICLPGYYGNECQHYDTCIDKPCQTGVCKNISNTEFHCECNDGHFGGRCEHFNPCVNKPCRTIDSACHNISDSEYTCECPEERYGSHCENINGCKIHFCHNNSTCTNISHTGDVDCHCPQGYSGKFCDEYDPCLLFPCENGGICTSNEGSFSCDCPIDFQGDTCKYIDPCVSAPCWNNGSCITEMDDIERYNCKCDTHLYGQYCENVRYCDINHDCQNGATCTIIEGRSVREVEISSTHNISYYVNATNLFTCDCRHGYVGTKCEKLSACAALPCGKGRCKQKGEGHVCFCPDGTERSNCDDAFCEEDGPFYDKTGRYHWPKTRSGDVARIRCRYGPVIVFHDEEFEFASRDCAVQSTGEPYWKPPDTSGCLELKDDDVSRSLRDLESLTRDASGLISDDIANITSILEEYFYFSFENQEIAREITMVVGNLLDANETVLIESNSKNHSSERLVGLLDEYVSKVKTDTNITIETENINLQIVNYTQSEDTGYHYLPNLMASREPVKSGVSLRLPPETLSVSGDDDYPRLELTTFRASSFFIPEYDAPTQEVVNKQWVVTAVIHGRHLKNLTEPVEIIIENIENRSNHTCVFWDTENRTWSSAGVVTLNRGDNYTRCMSYHLTSFAILLDPSPEHALSSQHEQILTYISYIGCGISIVGLALTILTYSLFRSLNREKSGKILMNLCSSLLLLNIVFILGSETSLSLSGDAMCKVVAILLHYFLLSTLTWMLVEAINMYQALITVFTKYSGYFMLKRCIFAWGVPAIVVIVTVAIDDNNYRTSTELCFLSQGSQLAFYISLLGPACLILMINIAVFIMVSRVILKPRFTGQVSGSDSLNPAQIRGAFAVMTLLGVTWVFGPFAINEAKVVVNYVFTILNSLQGFLIFVFRCCFNPEVRMAWVLLIKTGKLKRRRGPIKGMYTSETTSSKGDTKLNGSFDDTVKSNVYNSIGKPRNILNNDRNLDTKSQNALPKASKDPYFDDYNKVINDQNNRRVSNTETNGRHRSVDQSVYERNGYNKNGDLRNGDFQGGITTIYTGKNVRRLSGFVPQQDEFTRL